MVRLSFALAVTALSLVGCGSASGPPRTPDWIVPADAAVYAEVSLDLDDAEAARAKRMVDALVATGASKVFPDLGELTAQLGAKRGPNERIGYAIFDEPDGAAGIALIFSTDDVAALRRAADRVFGPGKERRIAGVDVLERARSDWATAEIDRLFVVASPGAIERMAVDRGRPRRLPQTASYAASAKAGRADHEGFVWVDPKRLVELLPSVRGTFIDRVGHVPNSPYALAVRAHRDGAVVDIVASGEDPAGGPKRRLEPTPLLRRAPRDSFVAVGLHDLHANGLEVFDTLLGPPLDAAFLKRLLRMLGLQMDRDLIAWAGDAMVYAPGDSSNLEVGALINAHDIRGAQRTLKRLVDLEIATDPVPGGWKLVPFGAGSTTVTIRGSTVQILYRAPRRAPSRGDIRAGAAWRTAVGGLGDARPAVVVDVDAIERLAAGEGWDRSKDWQEVKPYVDALSLIAIGKRADGRARVFAQLPD